MRAPQFYRNEGSPLDDRWIMLVGIPLIGIALPTTTSLLLGADLKGLLLNVGLTLLTTLLLWLGCRWFIMKLWSWLPWHKRPLLHFTIELLVITTYTLLVSLTTFMVIYTFVNTTVCSWLGMWKNFGVSLFISLAVTFFHEGLYFFTQWKESLMRNQFLEKENLVAQFETLRSQVNPHFLFNTFNTLLALIEEDRQKAIIYVQRLSDFYRSILQVRDQPLIPLKEELDLIDNYMEIQRQRYEESLQMEYSTNIKGVVGLVAPLTLQMLIENAIKHNTITTASPLLIKVELTSQGYITVTNNLQRRISSEPGAGLGLQNIRNRYHFLTDKPIEIINSNRHFCVAIPLVTSDGINIHPKETSGTSIT